MRCLVKVISVEIRDLPLSLLNKWLARIQLNLSFRSDSGVVVFLRNYVLTIISIVSNYSTLLIRWIIINIIGYENVIIFKPIKLQEAHNFFWPDYMTIVPLPEVEHFNILLSLFMQVHTLFLYMKSMYRLRF